MKRTIIIVAGLLVFGLSGGAFAASKLGGKDIKDGSLTGRDIRNGSIGRADVNFRTGDGVGPVVIVSSRELHLYPGDTSVDADPENTWQADCPSGYHAIGTGFDNGIGSVGFVQSYDYFVGAFMYNDTSIDFDVSVQAICARSSGVSIAANGRNVAERAYAKDLAGARAG